MAQRVEREAARAGVERDGVALLVRALRLALAHREGRLPAGQVDLLHPARVVLILLSDAAERDASVLAAAALAAAGTEEEGDAEATAGPGAAADPALREPLALARTVPPREAADGLAEALVAAPASATRIALAAWLDYVRHLHLGDRSTWAAAHRLTREVYLPVADRSEPVLARRLAWWTETFGRRFLDR
ncbi:MAG TPA: hypothetical protein VMK65_07295 [Longimicrobiales bacterium]|nr:hypothetical protein [Longimicrobiales bacterium]